MSKAFTKEDGGPEIAALPDLPQSPHPNYVTPEGLVELQDRARETSARVAALRAEKDSLTDLHPIAVAERDLRFWQSRLGSAIPVDPRLQPPGVVDFGAWVEVLDEDGRTQTYRIVGEDQADAKRGLIAPASPLARALLLARVGDVVTWARPAGDMELEITAIRYA